MKNNKSTFAIEDGRVLKMKMLNWARRFNIFCFLDNSNYHFEEPAFECLLAAGKKNSVSLSRGMAADQLQEYYVSNKDWLFGHLGYECLHTRAKNSDHFSTEVNFSDGFLFSPQVIIKLLADSLVIESAAGDPDDIFREINDQETLVTNHSAVTEVQFQKAISKDEYIHTINALKGHILRGDCYEINFCQSFFANDADIDPYYYYQKLSSISPNPFGVFYRLHDKYCLCASPERFLQKKGSRLLSQPIKGTSKRNLADEREDENSRRFLLDSVKEKSENVMIVDLVRNDLSKVCTEGSVRVKELFGVYSFPQVHQMISSIEGEAAPGVPIGDIIKACFPMGSMTGAPKIKVMELIEKYEQFPRGLFSGSIGYISPDGDFDFNVVIRSLMYDKTKKLISFKAGGGITFNSDPEAEYEESLLKAAAIIKLLSNDQ